MKKEYEFLAHNPKLLSQYRGQWIAVVDDKLVSHSEDFDKVYEEARTFADEPVFLKIPKEEVVVYAHRVPVY